MTDWGRNSFWQDLVDRLEVQERGTRFAPMTPGAGAWTQASDPVLESPPGLLQGRLLVADVTDRRISLYPLGLAGRFRMVLEGEPTSIEYRPGVIVVRSPPCDVEVRVSTTLPVVELRAVRGALGETVRWEGLGDVPADGAFVVPPSFAQDPVIERNNSRAPDPEPLDDLRAAGAAALSIGGRLVIALAADAAAAAEALAFWEQVRGEETRYWEQVASRLSVSLPDPLIQRQFPFSVHNSLFSRSVDESGGDIFVHGRRDRGYADASHLHQSFQMYFAALAAGEGASVRDELIAYCRLQDADGWIELAPRPVRGSSRYVGRYTGAHLLLAADRYLAWTGDEAFFEEPVVSSLDGSTRTVAERIDLAARDLLAHRHTGLVEPCGWADAWNPEVRAQGQISAAAVLGLRAWARASAWLGRDGDPWSGAADDIAAAMVATLYDPGTGILAEHLFDSGVEGGAPDDYWAHTQVWAALAGVVTDGRGLDLVASECLDHGVAIAPEAAFDKAYVADSTDALASLPVESTATWLLARWPEVTHLYALAEVQRGHPDAALAAVIGQLPETLHGLDPVCAPFYYAEKYLFPGTRPWLCTWAGDPSLVEVMLAGFLGVEPGPDGLHISPSLPSSWVGSSASAVFQWRGTEIRLELDPDLAPGTASVGGALTALPVSVHPGTAGPVFVRISSGEQKSIA